MDKKSKKGKNREREFGLCIRETSCSSIYQTGEEQCCIGCMDDQPDLCYGMFCVYM